MNAAVQRVFSAAEAAGLQPVTNGTGFKCWSPICQPDHKGSRALSIGEGTKQPAVFKCHHDPCACTEDATLAALGLSWSDVCEPTNGNPAEIGSAQGRATPRTCDTGQPRAAVLASKPKSDYDGPFRFSGLEYVKDYRYQDASGADLFAVVRYYDPEAKGKTFRQFRKDGDGWTPGLLDTERVLYNLPAVVDAVKQDWTLYVVEGEKCADSINALDPDYTATTNPMGEGKWLPTHTAAFEGAARAVVVADADDVGRKHAQDVAESLRPVVAKVDVLIPPSTHDVADHLAAGLSLDDLVPLSLDTVVSKTTTDVPTKEDPEPLGKVENESEAAEHDSPVYEWKRASVLEMVTAPPVATPWVVPQIAARDELVVLTAPPKHLKTHTGLSLSTHAALGRPVWGVLDEWPAIKVLWIDEEMGRWKLQRRLQRLAAGMELTEDELRILDANLDIRPQQGFQPSFPDHFEALKRVMGETGPDLVVIDSIIAVTPGDENKSTDKESVPILVGN